MSEIFTIIRIDEPDFGCEGLPEGEERKDDVTVESQNGSRYVMKIADDLLYEKDLDEGDRFTLDIDGNISKI